MWSVRVNGKGPDRERSGRDRRNGSLSTDQYNPLVIAENKRAGHVIDRTVVFLTVELNRGDAALSRVQVRAPAQQQQQSAGNDI
jgi:hypothetical protein